MTTDAAEALRRLHDEIASQLGGALAASETAREVAEKLALLTGKGVSTDELVTATVDRYGLLERIEFDEEAPDLAPDALRISVLEAFERARTDLNDKAAEASGMQSGTAVSAAGISDSTEMLDKADRLFQEISADWPGGE